MKIGPLEINWFHIKGICYYAGGGFSFTTATNVKKKMEAMICEIYMEYEAILKEFLSSHSKSMSVV